MAYKKHYTKTPKAYFINYAYCVACAIKNAPRKTILIIAYSKAHAGRLFNKWVEKQHLKEVVKNALIMRAKESENGLKIKGFLNDAYIEREEAQFKKDA